MLIKKSTVQHSTPALGDTRCASVWMPMGMKKGKVLVSVFAHLMKGENDDYLPWLFTGEVTVQLLNQLEDNRHHSETITFSLILIMMQPRTVNI